MFLREIYIYTILYFYAIQLINMSSLPLTFDVHTKRTNRQSRNQISLTYTHIYLCYKYKEKNFHSIENIYVYENLHTHTHQTYIISICLLN